MKKLLLFFAIIISISTAVAQKISADNVPAAVITAFKAKFSIAEKTSWEIDYDNYEADFTVGKTDFSAKFDKDGKWLETLTYLKPSELPKEIKEALSKKYGDILSAYKIDDAKKIEKEKETIYTMEITKGENVYDVEFDHEWVMVKEEQKSAAK